MIGVGRKFAAAVTRSPEELAIERAELLGLTYRDGHARCPVDDAPLAHLRQQVGRPTAYAHLNGAECTR